MESSPGRQYEANGRFHSDWLSMIVSRDSSLARNLLSDDGVMFVSISDHEVDNVRKVLEQVFERGTSSARSRSLRTTTAIRSDREQHRFPARSRPAIRDSYVPNGLPLDPKDVARFRPIREVLDAAVPQDRQATGERTGRTMGRQLADGSRSPLRPRRVRDPGARAASSLKNGNGTIMIVVVKQDQDGSTALRQPQGRR